MKTLMKNDPLTISICTKDRPEKIKQTLEFLIAESGKNNLSPRILVIDSSRGRETKKVVENLRKEYGISGISYHRVFIHSISAARNIAVRLTGTKYLCFIDDDVVPQKFWMTGIYNVIIHLPQAEFFFGPIYPVIADGGTASPFFKRVLRFTPWVLAANKDRNSQPFPHTANMAVNTKIFKKIGLFNTVFANMDKKHFHPNGEDVEFFQRAKEYGILPVYVAQMAVKHLVDSTRLNIFYLLGRYYDDGMNRVLFNFYSRYYAHSSHQLIDINRRLLNQLLDKSRRNGLLGIVYFLFELVGQIAMSYVLVKDFSYYNKRRFIDIS